MPSWVLKAVIHKSISLLPFKHQLNHVIQRYITRSITIEPEWFEHKLDQCNDHIEHFTQFGSGRLGEIATLELGTGWHPIIPLALYVCGISTIRTIDEAMHTNPERVKETLRFFVDYADRGELEKHLPLLRQERVETLRALLADTRSLTAIDLLNELGIETMIGDARAMKLPDASIDLFVSNNTLEHIPAAVIQAIFVEFRRMASPGSVMSHFIDMTDHYAHFDRSITHFNFLKFSAGAWKLIDNTVRILNRLRIGDYRKIYRDTRFKIVFEEHERSTPETLASVRLAKMFQHHPAEELLITHCWLVAVPA